MTNNQLGWFAAVSLLLLSGLVIAGNATKPSGPAPTTTTVKATTTTSAPPRTTTTTTTLAPGVPSSTPVDCARLQDAKADSTVTLDGTINCEPFKPAPNVTLTGTVQGHLACHGCDGWRLDHLTVLGNVQMVGGIGWRITDSHLDGQNAGLYGVLAVGYSPGAGQPQDWTIERTLVERPGNSPDHTDVQDHAVYVNGGNQIPMRGTIVGSDFRGSGAGATLKLGGTGNDGSGGDAADAVTVTDTLVTNAGASHCVLLSTGSDLIKLDRVTLGGCPEGNLYLGGPWYGKGLTVTNVVTDVAPSPWMVVWYFKGGVEPPTPPIWGTDFQTIPNPEQGCAGWATCSNNRRPS